MPFSFEALRGFCNRCQGRHPTELHYKRKVAARVVGRGETVEQAAAASRMPEATVRYWARYDTEFQHQVQRARHTALMREARRVNRSVQAWVDHVRGEPEGGSAA